MRMEYRHLELLVAIDETGSLSAAARRLNTDQAHVSRVLSRIEDHLGAPVFRRTPGGVQTTASGVQVLTRARRALQAAHDFEAPAARGPVVRILHSRIIVSTLVKGLQDAHPGLMPELAVADADEAHRRLQAGDADVYVGICLPHVPWPQVDDLTTQRVATDPLHLLLPENHPHAAAEVVDLRALSGDDWICAALPDARTMTIEECRAVGGFEPRLRYEVLDSEHMRLLLTDGLGVAFASSTWRAPDRAVMRPYAGSSPSHWSVVSAPGRFAPEITATLVELVRRRFAEISALAGRPWTPS